MRNNNEIIKSIPYNVITNLHKKSGFRKNQNIIKKYLILKVSYNKIILYLIIFLSVFLLFV